MVAVKIAASQTPLAAPPNDRSRAKSGANSAVSERRKASAITPDPHAKTTCRLVRAAQSFTGKQGLDYAVGISAEAVGATGIHLQIVTIPPLARARAHKHEAHETAIYTLGGSAGCWYGDALAEHAMLGPGDFFYIPAGVPHLPYNPSETAPYVAVIARTDPNEQESVVLLPDLDAKMAPKLDSRLRTAG